MGWVLRLWDADLTAQAEQRHGLATGSIHAAAFEPGLLLPAITGRISDEQRRTQVAQRLSAQHGVDAAEAVAEWSRPCGRIDAAVLALLRRQRLQRQVVVLTNATTRLQADLAVLGVTGEVDAIFSNAELGAAKPRSRRLHAHLRQLRGSARELCLRRRQPWQRPRRGCAGHEGARLPHAAGARHLPRRPLTHHRRDLTPQQHPQISTSATRGMSVHRLPHSRSCA